MSWPGSISSLTAPLRELPKNLEFLQLDITKDMPFEPAAFDIIHMRFLLLHVSTTITTTITRQDLQANSFQTRKGRCTAS